MKSAAPVASPPVQAVMMPQPMYYAPPPPPPPPPPPKRSGLSGFIHENTQFLSSVVIGGAGLIATSLYQWNQSKLAQRNAEEQRHIEAGKADNEWRIERAKILAQNLATLTARGGDNVEQRYGVLLSLTRGNLLDPELAVSYALELGKDSPEYMHRVLGNIEGKDSQHYLRLATAYLATCEQRYGLSVPTMAACKDDNLAARSQALADGISDDTEAALLMPNGVGPLVLLKDERYVHNNLIKLVGLFSEFIIDNHERRMTPILDRFMSQGNGARLVGTYNLLALADDSANGGDPEVTRKKLDEYRTWLDGYISGPDCDTECKLRQLSIIVSYLGKGPGQFQKLLRSLLERPRPEVMVFISRLHGRLALCQIDPNQLVPLRDQVLVPALLTHADKAQPDQELIDQLVSVLAELPLPSNPSTDWKRLFAELPRVTKGRQPKLFDEKRLAEQLRRQALLKPPAPVGKVAMPTLQLRKHKNFCEASLEYQQRKEDEEP